MSMKTNWRLSLASMTCDI